MDAQYTSKDESSVGERTRLDRCPTRRPERVAAHVMCKHMAAAPKQAPKALQIKLWAPVCVGADLGVDGDLGLLPRILQPNSLCFTVFIS